MNCYLCNSTSFKVRNGAVRDLPEVKVLECLDCTLVFLSSNAHIKTGFYENSGMHGPELISIDEWLKLTDWDDQRRFDVLQSILPNKRLLDFGCGAAGFLNKARGLVSRADGLELEKRVQDYWNNQIMIRSSLDQIEGNYDLITAFHVIEHLSNPIIVLKELAKKLSKGGRMIIEVPNSNDALLTLYECKAFQNFTYWSQHLFLFNPETMDRLLKKAGLKVLSIQQFQRYPISNHLHWIAKEAPGGHQHWGFLDSNELRTAYQDALASVGKCDTLIAYVEVQV